MKKRKIIYALLILFIFRLLFALYGPYHPDLNNHIDWGIRFFEYGPKNIYSPESNVWSYTWPNQPPGTMLTFAGIRKLYEFIFNMFWQINISVPVFPSGVITFLDDQLYVFLLKLPAILSDFVIAWVIYKIVRKKLSSNKAVIAALVFLLNPVIWYNSAIWGQTDSIINALMLLGFYLLLQKKLTKSLFFVFLSLFIKISLVIFVPVYLVLLYKQRFKTKIIAKSSILASLPIFLITLIFSTGNTVVWLFNIYSKNVLTQQLQIVTANAFNFWAAIGSIHQKPHSLPFLFANYQIWGIVITLLAILPIFRALLKTKKLTELHLFWALALLSFSTWMFLTNMHERYLYPMFAPLTITVFLSDISLKYYATVSFVNLLNLYNFWWTPMIMIVKNVLSIYDRIATRFLAVIMVILYFYLYSKFLRHRKV